MTLRASSLGPRHSSDTSSLFQIPHGLVEQFLTQRFRPEGIVQSQHRLLAKPIMFGFGAAPADDRIRHVVGIAVRTFLAAYRRR
jgi:hypothetical protein